MNENITKFINQSKKTNIDTQYYAGRVWVDITNHRYSGKLTFKEIKAIEKQCSEIEEEEE